MPLYSENEAWADVVPIPHDEGGPNPLAAIAYSDEYSDATAYLRAVMAEDEKSERVLELTETIISMNPAHYTVWLYRASTLFALGSDLKAEIAWLNGIALRHLKNYQIWQHRQMIVDKLDSAKGEAEFIWSMFEMDAKNYHVWSYRQWLVRRFGLWDKGELETVEKLIRKDVRNNSAWNHRWFVVFGNKKPEDGVEDSVLSREIEYAHEAIKQAPQNQSPWNYLRGLLKRANKPLATVKDITTEFATLERLDDIRSSHALDLLAEIYAEEQSEAQAAAALDLLANKYDPIRANYWAYRKSLLQLPSPAA